MLEVELGTEQVGHNSPAQNITEFLGAPWLFPAYPGVSLAVDHLAFSACTFSSLLPLFPGCLAVEAEPSHPPGFEREARFPLVG